MLARVSTPTLRYCMCACMSVNTYPEVLCVCVLAVCSCVHHFGGHMCVLVYCVGIHVFSVCMCVSVFVCVYKCMIPTAYNVRIYCMYFDIPTSLLYILLLLVLLLRYPMYVCILYINMYTCMHVCYVSECFASRCVREHRKRCPKW